MGNTTHQSLSTEALLNELDLALEAYSRSIDHGLALAAEITKLADSIDADLADARAELSEWF